MRIMMRTLMQEDRPVLAGAITRWLRGHGDTLRRLPALKQVHWLDYLTEHPEGRDILAQIGLHTAASYSEWRAAAIRRVP